MKIQTLLVAVFLPFAVAFAADPVTAISKNDKELQVLLKKQSLSKKDKEKVKGLLSDVFNFNLLAEKSLPKETWNGLDEAAKKQFASEYRELRRELRGFLPFLLTSPLPHAQERLTWLLICAGAYGPLRKLYHVGR